MFRHIPFAILSILFLSIFGQESITAQDNSEVSELRKLYTDSKFIELLRIIEAKDDDLSELYRGKSYYALDRCSEAIPNLSRAIASTEVEIKEDARWTIILCHIQLRDFTFALHQLFDADTLFTTFTYKNAANSLKKELLAFLTEEQLLQLSRTLTNPDELLELFELGTFTKESPLYSHFISQLSRFHVDSTVIGTIQKSSIVNLRRNPPKGFTYRVGVLLPYNENPLSIESQNSRAIYNGILLAMDEPTGLDGTPQIHVQLMNSAEISDSSNSIMNSYWIEKPVDIVVGPLFSSRTTRLASHISEFNIPVIVPLANSDEIQSYHGPIIQLNPTFSIHGREMARYAINTLGLDTVSIITDRSSLGYAAAISFKEEAERLGAIIPTFFAENMANTGYYIRPFTETLYVDSLMIDSLKLTPPQAIYAPFTGSGAQTLIRLLLTDLSAKKNPLPILGLEEWNSEEAFSFREDSTRIYYSTPFLQEPDSIKLSEFIERYEQRFGEDPSVLSQTGYDTGLFVKSLIGQIGNPSDLLRTLQNPPTIQGLRQSLDIRNFVNQSVHIYPLIE